jgi:hypothetical protein
MRMSPQRQGVSMDERPAPLGIQVAGGPDDDAEQLAEATMQLRRELLDLDVEGVEVPRAGEAPAGEARRGPRRWS